MLVSRFGLERGCAAGLGHPDLPPGRRHGPRGGHPPGAARLHAARSPPSGATSAAVSWRSCGRRTCSSPWSSSAPTWPGRACSGRGACPGWPPPSSARTGSSASSPAAARRSTSSPRGAGPSACSSSWAATPGGWPLVPRAAAGGRRVRHHRPGDAPGERRDAVSALDRITREAGPSARLVDRLARRLGRGEPARFPGQDGGRRLGAGGRPPGLRADAAARRTRPSAVRRTPPPAGTRSSAAR